MDMNGNDKRVFIFDTTLRDGQQCPGAGMSFERNIEYAHLAHKLGVDVLEAGFPSASSVDFEIVQAIVREIAPKKGAPVVAALCQLREDQIDRTIEALTEGIAFRRARLHCYLPVDPELMQASLGERAKQKRELVKEVHRLIDRAARAGLEIQFSPEGYSRMGSNFDFTTDCIRAAVQAGASVINCPDTIGGACKLQGDDYFINHINRHAKIIAKEFKDRDITWSVHCHNDFGLAVENTINAVFEGPVRQIEGCINGIGERAGNASIEQCAMIIKHFSRYRSLDCPFYTGLDHSKLQILSDFVSAHMLPRQPHSPVCGENAARHSSGGHTNAILRDRMAYQPFDPEEVGNELSMVFGPLSGGNHAKSIIEKQGFRCSEQEKADIAQFIKERHAHRRKGITEHELMAAYYDYRKPIDVQNFDYSRSADTSSITLEGRFFNETGIIRSSYHGRNSALAALKEAVEIKMPGLVIESHNSESAGRSVDAKSISVIVLSHNGHGQFRGVAEDQDIEISAMKAFLDAVNKAYIDEHYRI